MKPWEERESFEDFVDFVTEQELGGMTVESVSEVRYAQTREYILPRV